MRLFMWLGLAVLVYLALRKQARRRAENSGQQAQQSQAAQTQGEQMVACAVCHVFVPESEALMRHGQAFCCQDHADRSQ